MPTPVAALLNRPETTFKRERNGASGSRLLLNCMSAPAPFAHQCSGLTPLPMNRTAKRCGGSVVEVESLPQTGSDSSQGRAIVTPRPRRRVRRLMDKLRGFIDRDSKGATKKPDYQRTASGWCVSINRD